jgi:4-hydroxy-3-methylbut-2-enyl diphosphate reductase
VGEPVEAYVVRVNDVEGFITLSKRRLDTSKNWEIIESAVDTRAVLEGTVIEENRGGVIVNVMGTRVFVPGSQSGLAKDVPLTELLKQKVKLRVIEASKVRNRVVGSIRSAKDDTRRERSQKIWEDIEEGKVYRGRVKTLTDFGAFIDIGGVDGMAHISTLSWVRIKHPSDVLTEGQEVDVYVVGLDREKKKISLGYRDLNENPFVKFTEKYHTGDVIEVKIVKLATYGAFAQIMPDVDGLIHVSEISDNRIEKPSDALVEDELVNVRIINIDYDKKRVSLSIRAVNNYNPPDEASEYSDYSPIAAVADETADAAVEATNEVSNEE